MFVIGAYVRRQGPYLRIAFELHFTCILMSFLFHSRDILRTLLLHSRYISMCSAPPSYNSTGERVRLAGAGAPRGARVGDGAANRHRRPPTDARPRVLLGGGARPVDHAPAAGVARGQGDLDARRRAVHALRRAALLELRRSHSPRAAGEGWR